MFSRFRTHIRRLVAVVVWAVCALSGSAQTVHWLYHSASPAYCVSPQEAATSGGPYYCWCGGECTDGTLQHSLQTFTPGVGWYCTNGAFAQAFGRSTAYQTDNDAYVVGEISLLMFYPGSPFTTNNTLDEYHCQGWWFSSGYLYVGPDGCPWI